MTPRKPKLASRTYGKGSAAKQDARQKAHVQKSVDKLNELKARQAAAAEEAEAARERLSRRGAPKPLTNRVDRVLQAQREAEAVRVWRDAGARGKRPSTPNLDAVNAGSKLTPPAAKPTAAKAPAKRVPAAKKAAAAKPGAPVCPGCGKAQGSGSIHANGGCNMESDGVEQVMWCGRCGWDRNKAAVPAPAVEPATKSLCFHKEHCGEVPCSAAPRQSSNGHAPAALRFLIDGKPVPAAHNRLSGISRVSARNGGTRLSTEELRSMLRSAGIDPEVGPWSLTLPNGITIAAQPAEGATA